ncbi:Protein of unknown function [Bacillus mycoides]|nr:Protein of unknown function [Bacillus mycoides]
MVKYGG